MRIPKHTALVALAAIGLVAAMTGKAEAHGHIFFGLGLGVPPVYAAPYYPPAYYAPPPGYYYAPPPPPPGYYAPPPGYGPPPGYYQAPPPGYVPYQG